MEFIGTVLAIGVIASVAIPIVIGIVGMIQDAFIYKDKK